MMQKRQFNKQERNYYLEAQDLYFNEDGGLLANDANVLSKYNDIE